MCFCTNSSHANRTFPENSSTTHEENSLSTPHEGNSSSASHEENDFTKYYSMESNINKQNICCAICYEEFDVPKIVKLSCDHLYHMNCINEWFEKRINCPTCPLCRQNMRQLDSSQNVPSTIGYVNEEIV